MKRFSYREQDYAFGGHPGVVSTLSWTPSGELVVIGGSDALELVLLSRFDLVCLNFMRFVTTQNIKRLLLAAISFNRHYRSSSLELPCIMVGIVFW